MCLYAYIVILYLFKLILILVFNTVVNTYYINSRCNCSCKSNKNNSSGGIHCDTFAIDLDGNTLRRNENVLKGFKKINDLTSTNPKMVIHGNYLFYQNIYYTIDEDIFNSIKKDNVVTITKNSDLSDKYIVFAVKTRAKDFKEEEPEYDYYLVYSHNGNNEEEHNNGLFCGVDTNVEIIILRAGNNLTDISYMFFCCTNLKEIIFTIKGLHISNVTNKNGMLLNCTNLANSNISKK